MAQYTKEQLVAIYERSKSFRGLTLHGADFSDMVLERADFRGARIHYGKFKNCNLRMANFEGAGLTFTEWSGSDLHRVNLKDADLCDADMRGVKDFLGATITMECRTWKNVKLDRGFWYGWIYYALLMEPPTPEEGENLRLFMGEEVYTTLKNLYTRRVI